MGAVVVREVVQDLCGVRVLRAECRAFRAFRWLRLRLTCSHLSRRAQVSAKSRGCGAGDERRSGSRAPLAIYLANGGGGSSSSDNDDEQLMKTNKRT